MTFWVALLSALALTGLLIQVLRRARVLDMPNHRSSHSEPTPRGGGIALMIAFLLAVGVGGAQDSLPVLVPAVMLAAVGLADDLSSLSWGVRLGAQLLAAGVLVAWVGLRSGGPGPWLFVVLGVGFVAVVGYVNAFNFMDGINGISSLNAALSGGWFVWLGHVQDLPGVLVLGSALAGAALGFLPWNAASKVFLGDVGSYGIGAVASGLAVTVWAAGVPALVAVAPLSVYLADTGFVLVTRFQAGERLTEAHRGHVYQRLVQQGWPHLAAAGWNAFVAAVVCLLMAYVYADLPVLAVGGTVVAVAVYLTSPYLTRSRAQAATP